VLRSITVPPFLWTRYIFSFYSFLILAGISLSFSLSLFVSSPHLSCSLDWKMETSAYMRVHVVRTRARMHIREYAYVRIWKRGKRARVFPFYFPRFSHYGYCGAVLLSTSCPPGLLYMHYSLQIRIPPLRHAFKEIFWRRILSVGGSRWNARFPFLDYDLPARDVNAMA